MRLDPDSAFLGLDQGVFIFPESSWTLQAPEFGQIEDGGQTLDNPVSRRRSKIDLVLDLNREIATYGSNKPFRVRGLEAAMLGCLVKNDPDPTFLKELHEAIGPGNWHQVRKRLSVKLEQQGLTLEYIQGESVCLFEQPQEPPRSTDSRFDSDIILDRRPLFANPSALVSKDGFAISIDGIILNSASELIYGRVDSSRVQDCRLLYRSSIEDLAFALVYGSKLSSKWRPRHEVVLDLGVDSSAVPHEPAEILISQFENGLYDADIEDKRFRYGRVLDNEQARLQIGQYITSLAKAMVMPSVREICREWLVREADTYLGEHRSLFASLKKDELTLPPQNVSLSELF